MLPVWWGNLMEVFSDIGLGPIRADGGVTHRNQGSKKQNSKSNTNTQKTNTITKKKYKKGDIQQPGDKRQKCQDRIFCCNYWNWYQPDSATSNAPQQRNSKHQHCFVRSVRWMDGWMALTLSSAISADPDEQFSWSSPRWCRPHSLSAVFPPQKHSCQLICPVGPAGHQGGHQSRPTSLLGARQSASVTSTYWCIDTKRNDKIFFSLNPPSPPKGFKCIQIYDTEFRLV